MNKLKWQPDTCQCQFDIVIDEDEFLICDKVHNSCNAHNEGTIQERLDNAHADNVRKNKCVAKICEDHDVQPTDVIWQYDEEMNLSLHHPDIEQIQILKTLGRLINA